VIDCLERTFSDLAAVLPAVSDSVGEIVRGLVDVAGFTGLKECRSNEQFDAGHEDDCKANPPSAFSPLHG
jgi:hypothetical protein